MSGRRDSNPRPTAWKAVALPAELLPHYKIWYKQYQLAVFIKYWLPTVNYCIVTKKSGQSRVRTYVLVREQIYSLSPLTARPSTHLKAK